MRLGCLALGGGIFFLVFGYQGCCDTVRFHEPVTMTARDFLEKKPKDGWYRITEGTILLSEARFYTDKKDAGRRIPRVPETIFLPVHAKDDIKSKTYLVAQTKAPEIRAQVQRREAKKALTALGMTPVLKDDTDTPFIQHDVQGFIPWGMDSADNSQLAQMGEGVSTDFVVINEEMAPGGIWKAIGFLVGGVAALAFGIFYFLGLSKNTPDSSSASIIDIPKRR
jgi:hypothetical protein